MLEAAESKANKIHREIKQYKVRDDILKMNSIWTRLHKSRSSRSELEFDLSNFV